MSWVDVQQYKLPHPWQYVCLHICAHWTHTAISGWSKGYLRGWRPRFMCISSSCRPHHTSATGLHISPGQKSKTLTSLWGHPVNYDLNVEYSQQRRSVKARHNIILFVQLKRNHHGVLLHKLHVVMPCVHLRVLNTPSNVAVWRHNIRACNLCNS